MPVIFYRAMSFLSNQESLARPETGSKPLAIVDFPSCQGRLWWGWETGESEWNAKRSSRVLRLADNIAS